MRPARSPDRDSDASTQRLPMLPVDESKRLVLLFAPAANDVDFQEEKQRLAAWRGPLAERGVEVASIVGDRGQLGETTLISPSDARRLRRSFGAPRDRFLFVLARGDGSVMLKREGLISPSWLCGFVDRAD